MPSVHFTNRVSEYALGTMIETGAMAWAASAIRSPIGQFGGALFGAVHHLSRIALEKGASHFLNTENHLASRTAKVLAKAISILGSYGVAWAALASVGLLPITITHVLHLTIASIVTDMAIRILLGCLIGLSPLQEERVPD